MFWFPLPSPSFSFFPSSSFLDLNLNLNLNYLNYLNLNLLNLLNHSDWVMEWRLKWLPLSFVLCPLSLSLCLCLGLFLFFLFLFLFLFFFFFFFLDKDEKSPPRKIEKILFFKLGSISVTNRYCRFLFFLSPLFPNSVISTLSSCCFWVPWLLHCSQFHWSWVLTLNSFSFSFSSFSFSFASSSFSSSSSSFSFWTFQKEFRTGAWNLKISIESHLKK